ncbi:uncharacterized protein N7511_006217 [Penicillium nucicola]|uniref:uncharacterized protein n=1 Tax=Penicillium nucicola TaxID=1850975 RepID=UPI0025451F88|nr:uncharacterized protein N7511_006217 [Penicillium nucicola]KAJ5757523.1 hypothetical protein N7511_006217 [Penicillium nucicola]
MPTHEPPRTIAVLGATGNQGGGVVQALLNIDSSFYIRAITRDVTSASAAQLKAKYPKNDRLELVEANVYNRESLLKAFHNSYGVFAVTNNRLPGRKIETEKDMDHELEAGRNILEAAKACKIQHFVLSSLPNLTDASNGRFIKVYHFDNKSKIEEWARRELPAVTSLHPGLFYTNMQWSQYCRRDGKSRKSLEQPDTIKSNSNPENKTVRFCAPIEGNKLADWVDPDYDIGVYAASKTNQRHHSYLEIFALGPTKTASKRYPVVGPKLKFEEFAKTFTQMTGQEAVFDPDTLDQWGATVASTVGRGYEEDIRQMMQWISVAPDDRVCYGTMDSRDDMSWEDLGVRASTFAEWMERASWAGP